MLLFLDIDGVMVPAKSWQPTELLSDGFAAFSPKATRALQQLIAADTTIMLTTSHKGNFTLRHWKNIFRTRGITVKSIKSLENNVHHLSRKDEIMHWFMHHGPILEKFIIIDDDTSLYDLPPHLKQNLVLTSSQVGLTEHQVQQARTILGYPLQSAHS